MKLLAILCSCAMLLLAVAPRPALGATIGLETATTVVTQGSLFDIRVVGSGFPLGTDGGDFTPFWSANLEYVGIAIDDPPWDLSGFDDSTAAFGLLGYVDVFSTFDTPGAGGAPFDVATLTLRAIGAGPATVSIGPNLVGWSLAGETLDDVTYGEYLQLEVTPVPEPASLAALAAFAAVWLPLRSRRG